MAVQGFRSLPISTAVFGSHSLLIIMSYRNLLYSPLQWLYGASMHADSSPVSQYGFGLSADFLFKILGVEIPHFLCYTQLYFPLPRLLLHKYRRSSRTYALHNSSVGSVFVYSASGWGSIPVRWFLIDVSIIALEAVRFHLFLNSAFIYFGIIGTISFFFKFSSFNCFFNSHVILTTNRPDFFNSSLTYFVFIFEILDPSRRYQEGELLIFNLSRWEINWTSPVLECEWAMSENK